MQRNEWDKQHSMKPEESNVENMYILSQEDCEALARSEQDVKEGRFAADEEMEALFNKYRLR